MNMHARARGTVTVALIEMVKNCDSFILIHYYYPYLFINHVGKWH